MKQKIDQLILKITLSLIYRLRTRFDNKKKHYISWAISSPIKSTIYYSLFDNSFDNEHYRILNGKFNFSSNKLSSGVYARTRRNIHRIEKGISASLLVKREMFAKDYIEETVFGVEELLNTKYVNTPFHKWSVDVLNNYFQLVKLDEDLQYLSEKWKIMFNKFNIKDLENVNLHIPYNYSKLPISNIGFSELDSLFKRRHSVRWYNDKKVNVKLIKQAVESSLSSPSACNRQPFEVLYITGQRLNNMKALKLGFEMFSDNIKSFIFIVGDLSSYTEEQDKHLIYIDGGLFAMSLMLSLESLGISSCPINYPDTVGLDDKVQKILDLENYQKGVMLLSVGYANEDSPIPFSAKKELNEIFREIN
ncbi:nitroreductase family protein [Formosa undariae]|uniref:Nitroreductase family protein n=1 Tax=Formosa undariae TaxID=1325436 RepID=A0ABV5EW89_9FLAO